MRMKLQAELTFMWKVWHLDSFWNRGPRELENGLGAYKPTSCTESVLILSKGPVSKKNNDEVIDFFLNSVGKKVFRAGTKPLNRD